MIETPERSQPPDEESEPAEPAHRSFLAEGLEFARRLASAPEYRRLRWVVLLGTLLELILAPITSWGIDTPGFVQTASLMLATGNPYTTGLWFNPPLGPYADLPFMAIWNWFSGGAPVVSVVPALAPAATAAGLSTYVPAPGALLAWKLPLILANVVSALCLTALLEQPLRRRFRPEWIAAAWLLNPLVIWATAVHGEVDALAVALVLLAFVAISREAWLVTGFLLGLAILTKAYPLVLLPPLGAYLLFAPLPSLSSTQERIGAVGKGLVGIAAAALLFLPELGSMYDVLFTKFGILQYGALSVEVIFNAAVPKGSGVYRAFATNPSNSFAILELFRALGILAILAGAVLLAYRFRRRPGVSKARGMAWLAGASAWAVAGLLLMDPSPEAENVLGLLALLLLALPIVPTGRRLLWLGGAISLAGFMEYMSLATPVAFFPPLAALFGGPGIAAFNGIVGSYVSSNLRGWLWAFVGLTGGGTLLLIWGIFGWLSLPKPWRVRLRGIVRGPGEDAGG